jgi:uncharacterized membrane protein YraQ (UPF0718 family)
MRSKSDFLPLSILLPIAIYGKIPIAMDFLEKGF